MKLKELLYKVKSRNALSVGMVNAENAIENGLGERDITKICLKIEKCEKGALFVCAKSEAEGAAEVVKRAIKAGAVAVVRECVQESVSQDGFVITTDDCRKFVTEACKAFYGYPHEKMRTIAVIGTNGKTSVCEIVRRILSDCGVNCGTIGTAGAVYCGKKIDTGMTTPDPPELFEILSDMQKSGVQTVCMEYSAHGIFYKKADFCFDIAVWTNCTRDHLDFFKTFEEYRAVKISATGDDFARIAVVNGDDGCCEQITANRKGCTISYGIENPCDVFAIDVKEECEGTAFVMNLFDRVFKVHTFLTGEFNVYNALGAATACALCGVKTAAIAQSLKKMPPIEGRMQRVCPQKNFFVDYAHTPDGLEKALKALMKIKGDGKLICVFGCGGNRDKEKRALMGEASGKFADYTIITSDNPRYEEPAEIISQIEKGIRRVSRSYVVIADRAQAIRYAAEIAKKEDFVLVAGKGAEKTQEVMGVFLPFIDGDEIAAALCESENRV